MFSSIIVVGAVYLFLSYATVVGFNDRGAALASASVPFIPAAGGVASALGLCYVFGWNTSPVTFFGEIATLGTILIAFTYLVANLALPVYFRRFEPAKFSIVVHLVLPLLRGGRDRLSALRVDQARPARPVRPLSRDRQRRARRGARLGCDRLRAGPDARRASGVGGGRCRLHATGRWWRMATERDGVGAQEIAAAASRVAATASTSARSLSAWPMWPLIQCQRTRS